MACSWKQTIAARGCAPKSNKKKTKKSTPSIGLLPTLPDKTSGLPVTGLELRSGKVAAGNVGRVAEGILGRSTESSPWHHFDPMKRHQLTEASTPPGSFVLACSLPKKSPPPMAVLSTSFRTQKKRSSPSSSRFPAQPSQFNLAHKQTAEGGAFLATVASRGEARDRPWVDLQWTGPPGSGRLFRSPFADSVQGRNQTERRTARRSSTPRSSLSSNPSAGRPFRGHSAAVGWLGIDPVSLDKTRCPDQRTEPKNPLEKSVGF